MSMKTDNQMDFDSTKIIVPQGASFQEQFFFKAGMMIIASPEVHIQLFHRMKVSNIMVSKGIMGIHYLHTEEEDFFFAFLHLKY